jgi:hypothetical protein
MNFRVSAIVGGGDQPFGAACRCCSGTVARRGEEIRMWTPVAPASIFTIFFDVAAAIGRRRDDALSTTERTALSFT